MNWVSKSVINIHIYMADNGNMGYDILMYYKQPLNFSQQTAVTIQMCTNKCIGIENEGDSFPNRSIIIQQNIFLTFE